MTGDRPCVAVVGGGVLGVSAAWNLATGGADVLLIREGPRANGASGRSLSWLNSSGRRSTAYHNLRVAGLDRYRKLRQLLPSDCDWLRFDGGLTWQSGDREAELRADHQHEHAVGYPSEWLTPSEVTSRFAVVNGAAVEGRGAVWNPEEGWVDLPSLITWLMDDFGRLGGRSRSGTADIRMSTGGPILELGGERVECDHIVVATGSDVPATARTLGVPIPDASVPALLVLTEPVNVGSMPVLNTPRVSLRPAPGGALSVDADWASSCLEPSADGRLEASKELVHELLGEASGVLAGTPELIPNRVGTGPKPIPGDGEPVVGELPGIDGLSVVFSHSGATLALIVGELLAQQILTGEPQQLLEPFAPARFVSA